ncbi:cytochrome d ubiquinol oxidase subunit II [Granulibacter bethesdensis]|uniref:cytochrome d ubiquinol oxidase subunit II n=1 Tax=Granulibacter bethesdensis TaxID=364410 RepID=UPI00090A570B|nr:cytochrome d ubiquinol oxidase subunit II [Granulibacter bethesdensis]APH58430.1 Cyanide-insensitive cytochrome bd-type quinol oxidase subunit II [Granulibacter bethesdensis]
MITENLPYIWGMIIAVAVLAYVLLDGFDLGCGILFLAEREEEDRDVMVNSIAPVWDGNETWLVMGGGGLLAVFPVAYAILFSAFYPTIIAMLLALVFRGVAFEFRFKAHTLRGRRWWDRAFCLGSLVAALCQGMTLGGILQGVHHNGFAYTGGWFDWLTPFTVLCGVAVVVGYTLLGACWLILKTENGLHVRARHYAKPLFILLLVLIAAVSLWTPLLNETYRLRWFSWPGIVLTAPVPLLVAAMALGFWRSLQQKRHAAPLLYAAGMFLLCYVGLGISLFPNIVPPAHGTTPLSLVDAAAPAASQMFLLVGAVVLIPMVLGYNAYSYWIFRGKVRHGEGYH